MSHPFKPFHRQAAAGARSVAAAARRSDYTFGHAGHQVRLGPVAFWIVVGTLVIMAGWSIATGTYFAFRDDVLTRLISRQAEMQFAYEDRIAELRAQVDRITSRQLLDQEQFEQKLDALIRRQSVLEQRSSALGSIGADPMPTGSIPHGRGADATSARPLRPSPISDTAVFVAPPDREARLESRIPAQRPAPRVLAHAGAGGLDGMLSRMTLALDRVETKQTATLNSLEETYDGKLKRMRGVLADLGVSPGKGGAIAGMGGPYVPVRPPSSHASPFERQVYRIALARAEVDRYTHTLATVPVRKPVFGEIDMSSPFGMRMDPFVKGPAIHTGLDMRGDIGDPVRVTANGTVTTAGWNGGYGKMVEVDHGNGLTTRYGHLSEIDVRV